jgi:cellulose synthase/poly-beta-1,6-N-acetylglucosamine synthase-like glycosyltransferase
VVVQVAVVIPCHNEAGSIGRVIADICQALPTAQVVVCDNASNDGTSAAARAANAEVLYEGKRGTRQTLSKLRIHDPPKAKLNEKAQESQPHSHTDRTKANAHSGQRYQR